MASETPEWHLEAGETPSLGAHVVATRRGYTHHGIYVGAGKVVHYSGFSRGWNGGPVEEVPLVEFAQSRAVAVRVYSSPRFDGREIVARARSRLTEDSYRLLTNNCEHFCEWCVRGTGRSRQVESLLGGPNRASAATTRAMKRRAREWFAADPGHGGLAA